MVNTTRETAVKPERMVDAMRVRVGKWLIPCLLSGREVNVTHTPRWFSRTPHLVTVTRSSVWYGHRPVRFQRATKQFRWFHQARDYAMQMVEKYEALP